MQPRSEGRRQRGGQLPRFFPRLPCHGRPETRELAPLKDSSPADWNAPGGGRIERPGLEKHLQLRYVNQVLVPSPSRMRGCMRTALNRRCVVDIDGPRVVRDLRREFIAQGGPSPGRLLGLLYLLRPRREATWNEHSPRGGKDHAPMSRIDGSPARPSPATPPSD